MVKNYLRVAVRNLLRQKEYSAINILGLAVGMACCILILLFIQYEFSYDRHHTRADRIYRVLRKERAADGSFYYSRFTLGLLAEKLQADFPEVELAVRTFNRRMWVNRGDRGFTQSVCMADAQIVDIFDFPLVRGDRTGLRLPSSAFITQDLAEKLFGDADPMGQVISIDYKWLKGDFTVTGVMENPPETSSYGIKFDVLTASIPPSDFKTYIWENWQPQSTFHPFRTYVLLAEGASRGMLEQKLPGFVERHMDEEVKDNSYHLQAVTRVHLYSDVDFGAPHSTYGDIRTLYAFALVGLLILLIACVNFMNLATARSAGRAREVGLRKVVGARQGQLIGQFLGEAMLVSVLALGLALGLVKLLLPFWSGFLEKTITLDLGHTIGLPMALVGITLFVGLAAGSYPAFFLASFQPAEVLKGGQKTGSGRAWLRKGLVVFQFAISVVLIIATLVSYQQTEYIRNKDLGFNKEQMVVTRIFQADRSLKERFEAVKQAFLQHPNVLKGTAALNPPGYGNKADQLDLRPEGGRDEIWKMYYLAVDSDYPDVYELEFVEGRGFGGVSGEAVVLNETAVRQLGWTSAVGKQVDFWQNSWPVVGVVKDFHNRSLYQSIGPVVLVNRGNYQSLSLRIRGDNVPETMAFLEQTWKQFLPNRPFSYAFLDELYEMRYRSVMILRQAFIGFSLLAIFVACMGLFGLISYTAEQRTKEIGVRKVLGATVGQLVLLVSKDFLKLVGVANLIAWPVAYVAMQRWLEEFAYRIDLGVGVFVVGGVLAMGIAMGTVSYQAAKAARANPVDALRYE